MLNSDNGRKRPLVSVNRMIERACRWLGLQDVYERKGGKLALAFGLLLLIFYLTGCRQDMHDQPKYKPLRPSAFFADGRGARSLPEGSVARNQLKADAQLYTGKTEGGQTAASAQSDQSVAASPGQNANAAASFQGYETTFPFPIDEAALDRGEERFNIYCSVCHGRTGDGLGMIVRRGYRRPPSYHEDRLRQAPVGYLFDVITNGFGAMPDYAAQISTEDRWKIIAYIRALQLSQQGTVADVPPDKRDKIATADEQKGEQKQGEHNQ
jgi:mono/diheme cytochrome c family protein